MKNRRRCSNFLACLTLEDTLYCPFTYCTACQTEAYCSHLCQTARWPVHMEACGPFRYKLDFELETEGHSVSRTLLCPHSATFKDLSNSINIAFGWSGDKEYAFTIPNIGIDRSAPFTMAEVTRFSQNPENMLLATAEDAMHEGLDRIRIVEHKNWEEVTAIKWPALAHGFRNLPWVKQHTCKNVIPAEKWTLPRVFEDERYKGEHLHVPRITDVNVILADLKYLQCVGSSIITESTAPRSTT